MEPQKLQAVTQRQRVAVIPSIFTYTHLSYRRHNRNKIDSTMTTATTASTTTKTIAFQCLEKIMADIFATKSSRNSLAVWRLEDPRIYQALETFCNRPDWTSSSPYNNNKQESSLQEVQDLFLELNTAMAQQEQSVIWSDNAVAAPAPAPAPAASNNNDNDKNRKKMSGDDISVVFGGKYSPQPNSISERLISMLVHERISRHVFTVSRSKAAGVSSSSDIPSTITHLTQQNLDSSSIDLGTSEFQSVLQRAIQEMRNSGCYSNDDNNNNKEKEMTNDPQTTAVPPRLVVYFTLGQHKGVNPFARNIQAANNFATALERSLFSMLQQEQEQPPSSWKVVITGTDATLPSTTTYSSRTVTMMDGNNNTTVMRIPSYHIMEYNFIYAMSKLCQFYMIARAVAQLLLKQRTTTSNHDDDTTTTTTNTLTVLIQDLTMTIDKLQSHILSVGEDGNYHENDSRIGITIHTITELDDISHHWMTVVQPTLADHLHVASGISICYTPLHAVPWTEQSYVKCHDDEESNGSPKAYLIQQVTRRFKNAISIDMAAKAHINHLG